jgi:hypothetical protein
MRTPASNATLTPTEVTWRRRRPDRSTALNLCSVLLLCHHEQNYLAAITASRQEHPSQYE